MSATVIDQLIVKLGLDPREFTKGEKQAAAETVKLEKTVKRSAEGMSQGLMKFASRLTWIAVAVEATKKITGATLELSESLRQLGLDSANYGIAASQLKNFQNVAEIMGGKAGDVTKTVGGLQKAIYDLAYNGQVSDSLIMLSRLGVGFQDSAGGMRDFKDIAMDAQTSIQSLMSQGTSRANAFQMLQQAGFDPGLSQAMLQGNLSEQLARQEHRRQVTPELTGIAAQFEQSQTSAGQAVDAAKLRAFPGAAGVGIGIAHGIEGTADLAAGTDTLGQSAQKVRDAVPLYAAAISGTTNAMEWAANLLDHLNKARQFAPGQQYYQDAIELAAHQNGIPANILTGLIAQESNFNPGAVNPISGARGIAQLMPKYHKNAGNNPFDDINEAAKTLSQMYRNESKTSGETDPDALWNLALMDYNAGQHRREEAAAGGKPLKDETIAYPGQVLRKGNAAYSPTATDQGRSNVTFENVNVYSGAGDGAGLASDFVDTAKRKMMASQADVGQQ